MEECLHDRISIDWDKLNESGEQIAIRNDPIFNTIRLPVICEDCNNKLDAEFVAIEIGENLFKKGAPNAENKS